jgi:hypothetical protein
MSIIYTPKHSSELEFGIALRDKNIQNCLAMTPFIQFV